MIDGAIRLLAQRGLQGASFTEVLAATGAPRGSIYHHFPGGKDELVAAAITSMGARTRATLDTVAGSPPVEVAGFFLGLWRELLVRSQFTAGCSVLAVTVATDSADLLGTAAGVFRDWREALTSLLERSGAQPGAAAGFAALLIASSEGAVVMSRASQSLEPFDVVAAQLLAQAAALPRA